jgi:hypothetical protein
MERAEQSGVIASGLGNTSRGLPTASEKILDSNEEEKEYHSENLPNTEIAPKTSTTK